MFWFCCGGRSGCCYFRSVIRTLHDWSLNIKWFWIDIVYYVVRSPNWPNSIYLTFKVGSRKPSTMHNASSFNHHKNSRNWQNLINEIEIIFHTITMHSHWHWKCGKIAVEMNKSFPLTLSSLHVDALGLQKSKYKNQLSIFFQNSEDRNGATNSWSIKVCPKINIDRL